MGKHDWYRNTSWDRETSEMFESKLKRSRDDFNKAQYLRIQSSYLLASANKDLHGAGIRLMERLIIDFPEETFSTVHGKEQLGDFHFKHGDFEKALAYYQQVTDHYKINGRSGTTWLADVKLVESILMLERKEDYQRAYKLLIEDFEVPGGGLTLNDDRFHYARTVAVLCDKLGKKEEARKFAGIALDIAKVTEPQFTRHKTVGLVRASQDSLDTLTRIQNG